MKEGIRKVSLVRSRYESVHQDISRAIRLIGDPRISGYDSVIIKINLCDFRTPETGAVTHPIFLDAMLKYIREDYPKVEIYVVESDATVALPDLFVKWFGLLPIIQKWGAHWHNISKGKTRVKEINGRHFKEIRVDEIFEGAYFVTLPKMKTSSVTKISCALKNQFGCLPIRRKIKFHPFLDDVIVDVNLAMRPNLCVVDGIIAMGGSQGPTFGVPINANLILASEDPVAADSVCAEIMGFNPSSVTHVRKAHESKVGSMGCQVTGLDVHSMHIDFRVDPLQSLAMRIGARLRARVRAPDG